MWILWKLLRYANLLNLSLWIALLLSLTAISVYNYYNGGQVLFVEKVLENRDEDWHLFLSGHTYFLVIHGTEDGFLDYGGSTRRELVIRDLILKNVIKEGSKVKIVCCYPAVRPEFEIGGVKVENCGEWTNRTVGTYFLCLLTFRPE